MKNIRAATLADLNRIAEIVIFNYRMNFYPIFQNDEFYFSELQVPSLSKEYENAVHTLWVYDDGVVKGFVQVEGREVKKLFVEPILQGKGIGSALLTYAINELQADFLWALEKNTKAIAFYERHGFHPTSEKTEEDTSEYLIRLQRT